MLNLIHTISIHICIIENMLYDNLKLVIDNETLNYI